jgi:FkbM family methyltransferase
MKLKIKYYISIIICSNIIGNIIAYLFDNMIPFKNNKDLVFDCNSSQIKGSTKAQIFFGIYESAEYRFCKKYIDINSNVIELGSSIGLISTIISKYKKPKKIITVEANPDLINVIESNFNRNNVINYTIINKAISSSNKNKFWFCYGNDNTTGYISLNSTLDSIPVDSTTLLDILKFYTFKTYTLVCDIEGAEVNILFNDTSAFSNCNLMIIELHEVNYNDKIYHIDELLKQITKIGFKQIDRYGNSFVFSK